MKMQKKKPEFESVKVNSTFIRSSCSVNQDKQLYICPECSNQYPRSRKKQAQNKIRDVNNNY